MDTQSNITVEKLRRAAKSLAKPFAANEAEAVLRLKQHPPSPRKRP